MTQKRYVVRENRRPRFECGFLPGTFCDQPEVSTTSDSKVMTQIVVFMFFGDLDLDLFGRYLQKQKCKVSWVCRIYCKKKNLDRCKTVACRRCDRQTDRQTVLTNILCENALWAFRKVTNRCDQYTLRKVFQTFAK